jgi:hypothetical protein
LALATALVVSALCASSASAAVTVNTTTDSNAPGGCAGAPGDCSLHQAIAAAAPGETVVVPAGTYPLTLGGLTITQAANVQGAGARATSVIVDGGTSANAFVVASPDQVTISGMTISAGHVTGEQTDFLHGGAVLNLAGSVLSLVGVAVSGTTLEKTDASSGAVRGAGIANNGTLSIADSTVSGNTEVATESGSANQGAGLFNSGGTVSIVNTTFAGNSQVATDGASSSGSAIENLGTEMTLLNVTVAGNSGAPAVDNIATVNVRNSIVANGASGNCDGTLTSQGSNLESSDQCGLHAAGDQVGKDPLLGALLDNGGQTDTLALLPGSPAIDRGDTPACPPTDQRGIARPQGPACDVGAFELVPSRAATPSNAFKFGRLKRNTTKGTAILFISVPGPGTIVLAGRGVVGEGPTGRSSATTSKAIAAAGVVKLKIKAKGKAKRKLGRTGKAKLKVKVTYTPTGGTANTQAKTIKLIKRL